MCAVAVNLLAIPVQQSLFFRLTSSPTLKFNARTTANMRVTRSATRKAAADDEGAAVAEKPTENPPPAAKAATRKRKASGESPSEPAKKARATKASAAITAKPATQKTEAGSASAPPPPPAVHVEAVPTADGEALVPAVLTFSFEEARKHLIGVDPRFEDVFRKCKCKPFEELERVDPFRCVALDWPLDSDKLLS